MTRAVLSPEGTREKEKALLALSDFHQQYSYDKLNNLLQSNAALYGMESKPGVVIGSLEPLRRLYRGKNVKTANLHGEFLEVADCLINLLWETRITSLLLPENGLMYHPRARVIFNEYCVVWRLLSQKTNFDEREQKILTDTLKEWLKNLEKLEEHVPNCQNLIWQLRDFVVNCIDKFSVPAGSVTDHLQSPRSNDAYVDPEETAVNERLALAKRNAAINVANLRGGLFKGQEPHSKASHTVRRITFSDPLAPKS